MFFCKEISTHREIVRADKDRFSDKPTLSAQLGFQKNNPHYMQIM